MFSAAAVSCSHEARCAVWSIELAQGFRRDVTVGEGFMKILIRGAGFGNKGAEAMLRVVQRKLSQRLSDVVFYASVSSTQNSCAYASGVVPLVRAPDVRIPIVSRIPFVGKIIERLRSPQNPDFVRAVKTHTNAANEINALGSVDAVVDVSGFSYGDTWGVGYFKYAWPWLDFCQLKNKPYIFLPQAWGPFEKQDVAPWAKKFCETKALLVSRDDESSHYLAAIQGKKITEVRQCPDIAFCFQGLPLTSGATMKQALGITGQRPLIGLVPNMRVYERSPGDGSANHYVKLLIALANYCINVLGADVLVVPNEINVSGVNKPDDRFLCGIIEANIQKTEHCFSVRDYCTSETVSAVIGSVDLVLASRFHSLVFALTQGVPVVALGWSHKYRELLRSFGLENFVIDHDRVDAAEVISLVEAAWRHRASNSVRIRETVPRLQAQVEALFDEVATMIRKAHA